MKNEDVEKSEENYSLLAQALSSAKEFDRAIIPMEIAAEMSEDGGLSVRLASYYIERDRWDDCVTAITEGLRKGDPDRNDGKLAREDQAHVMMGTCYFNADNLSGALGEFRAARIDERSRAAANSWISYLTKERDRRRQLAQMQQ